MDTIGKCISFWQQSNGNGYLRSQYPNYDVTWERARKYNVGLEFGLWNGLLTGNFDYFYEQRTDILTQYLTRPQWVGVVMAAGNLGKTKNQGVELELKHNNRIGKIFITMQDLLSHMHVMNS